MNVKNLFYSTKLKQYLNYRQKGNIWRMYFTNNDLLVCETRDLEMKEVYFFSLNYKNNEINLKNFQLNEKWWLSIVGVNCDSIFLNYFRKPDLPEHLGFTSIDIKAGTEKWTNLELVFLFATDTDVFAYKQFFEAKIYYKLKANDGMVSEEYRDEENISFILKMKSDYEKMLYADFIYPEIFIGDSFPNQDSIDDYFKDRFKKTELAGKIEFIKYHDYLIYNFHKDNGADIRNLNVRNLSNILEIYDMTADRIVYDDTLNKSTSNYVPDSFFIRSNMLFYVKEKNALITVKLN